MKRSIALSLIVFAVATTAGYAFQLKVHSASSRPPTKRTTLIRNNPVEGVSFSLSGATTSSTLFATPQIETNDNKDPTLLSAQDATTQQLGFLAIFAGVIAGSFGFIGLYDFLEGALPSALFDPFYNVLPYMLSSAFIAAGIAHFAIEDTFTAFVPPKGSWGGLWIVPAPGAEQLGITYEQYHSYWSGIAEVVVGLSLIATTAGIVDFGYIPSALMYCITAAVTPANIYMYTHNPVVPRIPALPYPWGHAGRGLLQCALLAVFYKLTLHSM